MVTNTQFTALPDERHTEEIKAGRYIFQCVGPVEFTDTKLNRANMAAGTKILTGLGQHGSLEGFKNPQQNLEIAFTAIAA